jgi:glycosyltransferase involved in cell wall biosynthesis
VILTFVHYYLPGYKAGGPIRTIANMVEQLGDELNFKIVASDRDAFDSAPYEGVSVDTWNMVDGAEVFYASPHGQSLIALARLMRRTEHDVLYVNSFFDSVSTVRPLVARFLGLAPRRPLVIAPRGEFSEGALALKASKKRLFMQVARTVGLYRDAIWQGSSEQEAGDIRRELGGVARRVAIASNLRRVSPRVIVAPDLPPASLPDLEGAAKWEQGRPLRLVFLSRIARMKNLDYALRVLAGVAVPVEFSIYGSVFDESYWNQCQRLIDELPPNINAHYGGSVDHKDVLATLRRHDLFLLPTRGENYGHVIHEALTAGLPVLISDKTPWRDLVEKGVGWDLPLDDPTSFARVIEDQFYASAAERSKQAVRSRVYAIESSQSAEPEAQNLALFRSALNGEPRWRKQDGPAGSDEADGAQCTRH